MSVEAKSRLHALLPLQLLGHTVTWASSGHRQANSPWQQVPAFSQAQVTAAAVPVKQSTPSNWTMVALVSEQVGVSVALPSSSGAEGPADGLVEGSSEAALEGAAEAVEEGAADGLAEGSSEAAVEGAIDGLAEGSLEAAVEGATEGLAEGSSEAVADRAVDGVEEGSSDAVEEGAVDGLEDFSSAVAAFSEASALHWPNVLS